MLVVIVSLGYGVVKPTLGDDFPRVLMLGGCYGVASLLYSIVTVGGGGSKSVGGDPVYDLLSISVFVVVVADTT